MQRIPNKTLREFKDKQEKLKERKLKPTWNLDDDKT